MSVACPACGEAEGLRGRRDGDVIVVTCERCAMEWVRDPNRPSCPRCAGDDIVSAPKALVDKSRGTQLSVMATTTVHFCRVCDRDELEVYLAAPGGRMVMPDRLPTSSGDDVDQAPAS